MDIHPFVKLLRKEREIKDKTRQEVADAIGISLNTIGRWERGHRQPNITEIHTWAEFLGMKLTLNRKKKD